MFSLSLVRLRRILTIFSLLWATLNQLTTKFIGFTSCILPFLCLPNALPPFFTVTYQLTLFAFRVLTYLSLLNALRTLCSPAYALRLLHFGLPYLRLMPFSHFEPQFMLFASYILCFPVFA